MIERYIEQVSTYAADVDGVINLIGILVGFWFVITQGVFFYFMWAYRKGAHPKAEYISGTEPELKRWITIPHLLVLVCDVFIIVGAVRVWTNVKQHLPEPYATIRVIGQQWAWTFVHPGPDRQLDTADDIALVDELHVEKDRVYHFELESRDVLHSFSVPVFRLKQDVIPGRIIKGWFEATKTGEWDIQCAEICGIGHGLMAARIHIETAEQQAAWMAQHQAPTALAAVDGF
jgi:cytochrome c oxidase subunit 2